MVEIYTLTDQQAWAIAGAVFFMVFDIISGLAAAIINREVSSSKMRVGLGHKVVMLLFITLALGIEVVSLHVSGLGLDGVTVYAVCLFICVMEVASILENLCKAYPELANSKLMSIFERGFDKEISSDDNTEA